MFNVVINNEQYDEYLAQKTRIKELEKENELLKSENDVLKGVDPDWVPREWLDTLHEKWVKVSAELSAAALEEINEKQYYAIRNLSDNNDKLEAEKKELKDVIARNTARHNEMLFEKDRLVNQLHKYEQQIANQDKMIETLQAKIADYDNTNTRFKEVVTENYRLRMANNDLKANNKALKKEKEELINCLHDYESKIAELAEKATNPDYIKFLEQAKKFQEYNVAAHLDVLEEFQPACNLNIENLYITNNYFSKEDEGNE